MKTQEQLKKDIVDQLYWDARVDANDVKVKLKNHEAILTGSTPSFADKIAAGEVASSVVGISDVTNKVEVKFPTTYTVPSDSEIKKSIEQRLDWNTTVDPKDITITVINGVVTLKGTVESLWQKTNAEQEAQKVGGVILTTNKLTVVPTKKVTDEILSKRVLERIEENTVADLDNITVKVKNGVVTLTGEVGSWPTWSAVYDAAQFTAGVIDVNDQLDITYI